MIPSCASGKAKTASGPATLKSHASANSAPPPRANPSMAAMVGIGSACYRGKDGGDRECLLQRHLNLHLNLRRYRQVDFRIIGDSNAAGVTALSNLASSIPDTNNFKLYRPAHSASFTTVHYLKIHKNPSQAPHKLASF
jgi:hypothetical protein